MTKTVSTDSASSLADRFELKNISFMLVLLRVIMSAAFSTDESKNIDEAIKLVRKSSSAPDEETLSKKTSLKKGLTITSTADNILNMLMAEGSYGADILLNTDFSKICGHILALVSQIIQRKSLTLEDKFIVENAMALWTGCVLHQPDLFKQFVAW